MKLTSEQKLALRILAASKLVKLFYWTGGTLLSCHYLRHRYSEDLDFFSETEFSFEIISPYIQKLKEAAQFSDVDVKKIYDRWELLFTSSRSTLRIEFVYYNHGKRTLEKRQLWHEVYVDSLRDIAANKTFALIDRNEPKDLFDIYFIIHKINLSPEQLLDLVKKKFNVELPLDLFWSEAHKSALLLKNLKPMLLGTEQKKKDLIQKIEAYVSSNSSTFLAKRIV